MLTCWLNPEKISNKRRSSDDLLFGKAQKTVGSCGVNTRMSDCFNSSYLPFRQSCLEVVVVAPVIYLNRESAPFFAKLFSTVK